MPYMAPPSAPGYASGKYHRIPEFFASPVSTILVNNQPWVWPVFLHSRLTLQTVHSTVETAGEAGSVIRTGIYTAAAGLPGALLSDWGTASGTTTGSKSWTATDTLPAGGYWLCMVAQSATTTPPKVYCYPSSGVYSFQENPETNYAAAAQRCGDQSGALPATISVVAAIGALPILSLRAA